MAKRNSQRATNDDGASQTAQPALPATGRGPLAGYPVAAGATHARIHGVGDDGRIREAMSLGGGPDGPVTRIPVALVGDAALWDAIAPGVRVRCVFSRYHGDVLKTRIGQGPIWVVPPRGETVAERDATPAPAPAPASSEHGLFLILRELQREARSEADARSARELAAMRELYSAQASLTRDYFAQMTSMFLGERRDERQSAARERADAARRDARLVAATRAAVREEIDDARDDEDDDAEAPPDAVATAISGLGEIVRPLATEIGRRAIGSVGS